MPEQLLYKFRWQILLGLVGLGLAGAGLLMTRLSLFTPTKIEILGETAEEASPSADIVIEVSGSVNNPGVFRLATDSRVEDAIEAAGGLTEEANTDWLEKSLNRAARLIDGQKIYIPDQDESGTPQSFSDVGSPVAQGSSQVNINTASASQLEALWGIGPATADKIIGNRPYSSVEELLSKKILKSNVYEANRDKLSVY